MKGFLPGAATLGIFILASCAPYSVEDFKKIKAHTLRMNIKEWHLRGESDGYGYTNTTDSCRIASTNVPAAGHRVVGIIVLESSLFRGRGYLVGTGSGDVYWYDGKEAVPLKGRRQDTNDP
jgi:hypothetical protein